MGKKLAGMWILMGFFCSCVSLKTPQRTDLVPLKAAMTLGKYPVNINRTIKTSSYKDTVIPTVVWHYFRNFKSTPVEDDLELAEATHIELKLTDKRHLTAILYKGNVPLKTELIKGNLKKGYFRVKHELSLKGIPPFYWSISSAKLQYGIGKDRQLYIDSANETNGSILIMVAGTPGFTRSLTVPAYEK